MSAWSGVSGAGECGVRGCMSMSERSGLVCMVCVMDINVMFWWMCVCSWSALIECGACSGGDFGVCGCADVSECLWYVA